MEASLVIWSSNLLINFDFEMKTKKIQFLLLLLNVTKWRPRDALESRPSSRPPPLVRHFYFWKSPLDATARPHIYSHCREAWKLREMLNHFVCLRSPTLNQRRIYTRGRGEKNKLKRCLLEEEKLWSAASGATIEWSNNTKEFQISGPLSLQCAAE